MDLQLLDMNLQRCAIIQYASHIWKRPQMKEHVIKNLGLFDLHPVHSILAALHEELDKLTLPRQFKDELKFAIGQMGSLIGAFLKGMTNYASDVIWNDYVDYIDHIHFNPLGCINTDESIKSLYQSGLLGINYDTWMKLHEYCVEECIEDFWGRISKSDEYSELMETICFIDSNDYPLPNYWKLRMQNQLDKFVENVPDFDRSKTVDEFMVQVSQRNVWARHSFKYFWNRLNDDQKMSSLRNLAGTEMLFEDRSNYTPNELAGLCAFLTQQYLLYGFEGILMSMPQFLASMLSAMLSTWMNNFLSTLISIGRPSDLYPCGNMASDLMNSTQLERSYVGNILKTAQLFHHLWSRLQIFGDEKDIILSIKSICDSEEVEWIKYIIISEKSVEKRDKFLDSMFTYCRPSKRKFLRKLLYEVSEEIDLRNWLIEQVIRGINEKETEVELDFTAKINYEYVQNSMESNLNSRASF